MNKIIFGIILVSILCSIKGVSQSACELTLTKAQEEFDAGRFNSVPEILKECIERNQNREWRQRAYLLLAETFLLLEDPTQADESYLNVLRANPEFVTDESRDPIDLVYLSKKFTATPIFSFYGKVGLNATFITVINDVVISPQGSLKEEYSTRLGWQGGLGIEYHYNDNIGFAAEFNYSFSSYRHRTKHLFQDGNYNVDFTDRQTWLSIPVLAKYTWPVKPLQPYVYGGFSINVLIQDKAEIVINSNVESPVFDYYAMRNTLNRSLIAGGGLRYKWNLRYLFGDIRYSLGLSNIANPTRRFNAINESWPYVDDDFRLNNLFVSVGYIHPLYKARKLKNAGTKSVLRRIGRRSNEAK